jgi:hypothetical protein
LVLYILILYVFRQSMKWNLVNKSRGKEIKSYIPKNYTPRQ